MTSPTAVKKLLTGSTIANLAYFAIGSSALWLLYFSSYRRAFPPFFTGLRGGSASGLFLAYSGTFFLLGANLYSIVRRIGLPSFIRMVGGTRFWLGVHISLGFGGLVLVLLHAGFPYRFQFTALYRFGFAGLATWFLIAVCVSGLFGRYLYSKLPAMKREFASWRYLHSGLTVLLLSFAMIHVTTTVFQGG